MRRKQISLFLPLFLLLTPTAFGEDSVNAVVRDQSNRDAAERHERSAGRCEEGVRTPNERECTSYYECVGGRSQLRLCQYGYYFSIETSCCQPQPQTDFVCPRPPPPPPPPPPECEYGEMRPDPSDCAVYYFCVGGDRAHFERQHCGEGQRFNVRILRCEYGSCAADMTCSGGSCNVDRQPPQQMVRCDGDACQSSSQPACDDDWCPPPPPPPPPRRPTCDSDDSCRPDMSCMDGSCQPRRRCDDDNPCKPDMSCRDGSCQPVRRTCPGDSCQPDMTCREGTCARAQDAECEESGGPSGFRADPQDCRSFYQCAHGRWVHRNCPSNLVWNVAITTCDWPKNRRAGCSS